jgi:hypothetical protein
MLRPAHHLDRTSHQQMTAETAASAVRVSTGAGGVNPGQDITQPPAADGANGTDASTTPSGTVIPATPGQNGDHRAAGGLAGAAFVPPNNDWLPGVPGNVGDVGGAGAQGATGAAGLAG